MSFSLNEHELLSISCRDSAISSLTVSSDKCPYISKAEKHVLRVILDMFLLGVGAAPGSECWKLPELMVSRSGHPHGFWILRSSLGGLGLWEHGSSLCYLICTLTQNVGRAVSLEAQLVALRIEHEGISTF